jgi:hypothetical protein
MRLEIVLCHTLAIVVHDTEIVLDKGVTLIRSLAKPSQRCT